MHRLRRLRLGLIVAVGLVMASARAEAWNGAIFVGAGAGGFSTAGLRHESGAMESWELRVSADTRTPFGLEVLYMGSAQRLHLAGLDDTTLVSNGLDVLVRLKGPAAELEPYAFVGLGWRRYDVTRSMAPAMSDEDTAAELPMGFGAVLRHDRVLVDLRGTLRWSLGSALIPDGTGGWNTLDTWLISLAVGWSF